MFRHATVAVCFLLLAGGAVLAQQSGNFAAGTPAAGAAAPQPAGSAGQINLAAFSNITSCLPFNVLIKPSDSATAYTLTTDVSPEVDAALRIAVANNTLYLGFNKSFETTAPIRVTVSLPADKLQYVENKGMGSIIINPGFNVSGNVSLVTGSGSILARGINASALITQVSGTSDLFARGSFQNVSVRAQGTSTVTLSGVRQSVVADLQGISKLYLDAATDAVTIQASVEGLSKVYYNKGKGCADDKKKKNRMSFFDDGEDEEDDFFGMSFDFGFSSCAKVTDPEDYPSYRAQWSCGLRVRGAAVCVPGDATAQAAAQQAAVISVAAANTASGSSQATATAGPAPSSPATAATNTATAAPNTPPTVTSTSPPTNRAASNTGNTGSIGSTGSSPVVGDASEIRVAAAGRRRLAAAESFLGSGRHSVVSSSSSSYSSSDGRRSEAVAVASLDCAVADTELYIVA